MLQYSVICCHPQWEARSWETWDTGRLCVQKTQPPREWVLPCSPWKSQHWIPISMDLETEFHHLNSDIDREMAETHTDALARHGAAGEKSSRHILPCITRIARGNKGKVAGFLSLQICRHNLETLCLFIPEGISHYTPCPHLRSQCPRSGLAFGKLQVGKQKGLVFQHCYL